jgi:hypothetical protein
MKSLTFDGFGLHHGTTLFAAVDPRHVVRVNLLVDSGDSILTCSEDVFFEAVDDLVSSVNPFLGFLSSLGHILFVHFLSFLDALSQDNFGFVFKLLEFSDSTNSFSIGLLEASSWQIVFLHISTESLINFPSLLIVFRVEFLCRSDTVNFFDGFTSKGFVVRGHISEISLAEVHDIRTFLPGDAFLAWGISWVVSAPGKSLGTVTSAGVVRFVFVGEREFTISGVEQVHHATKSTHVDFGAVVGRVGVSAVVSRVGGGAVFLTLFTRLLTLHKHVFRVFLALAFASPAFAVFVFVRTSIFGRLWGCRFAVSTKDWAVLLHPRSVMCAEKNTLKLAIGFGVVSAYGGRILKLATFNRNCRESFKEIVGLNGECKSTRGNETLLFYFIFIYIWTEI